jgi:Transposase, Mutator family
MAPVRPTDGPPHADSRASRACAGLHKRRVPGQFPWRGVGARRTERSSGHRGAHHRRTSRRFDDKEAPLVAGPDRMTTEEVVRKVLLDEHADVLRESLKLLVRELMKVEVSELIGAELGERRPDDRATHRNGYRPRRWDTRAGEIELQIPKLREGSYFPSLCVRASARSRCSSRSFSRPMCAVSRPGASTSSSSRSGSEPRARRSRASAHCSTTRSRPSASARSRAAVPTWSSTPRSGRSETGPPCAGVRRRRPRRPRDGPARDHRARRRRGGDGGVLARVPPVAYHAPPDRRPARRLGRPRRAQERDRPHGLLPLAALHGPLPARLSGHTPGATSTVCWPP